MAKSTALRAPYFLANLAPHRGRHGERAPDYLSGALSGGNAGIRYRGGAGAPAVGGC